MAGRVNNYFIPGEGISREVIQADICRYLGNDATLRVDSHNGVPGYFITAYRNFTTNMINDLKADSVRWEQERAARGAAPGGYLSSQIHQSRQYWGPTLTPDEQAAQGGAPAPAQHAAPVHAAAGYPDSNYAYGSGGGGAGHPSQHQQGYYAAPRTSTGYPPGGGDYGPGGGAYGEAYPPSGEGYRGYPPGANPPVYGSSRDAPPRDPYGRGVGDPYGRGGYNGGYPPPGGDYPPRR